jgi:hypothetical protein
VFDARYHALTLVAVFVALMIGLLLGVAIGDQGLVSGAERDLRENLRSDVESARGEARDMRAELDRRERYERQTYPAVVADRLAGRRIAVLTLYQAPSVTFEAVREAIGPAGGEVSFVGRLQLPPDLDLLGELAAGTRYERLAEDPELVESFATRVGQQLLSGGRLVRDSRRALFASSSGELTGVEGVVLIRGEPPARRDRAERELEERFVNALLRGLEAFGTPVAGVERTDTEPSNVEWYRGQDVSSIDNVDQIPGRTSLVLVLAGGGAGAYGVKSSAESLLPEALVRSP